MPSVAIVTADGIRRFGLSELAASYPVQRETYRIDCASSGRSEQTWRCVPLLDLLLTAGVPERATHLVVRAADGYQAPVAIATAYRGHLGIERLDRRAPTTTGAGRGPPRLLAPDVPSERAVRAVRRIDWIAADPDEDIEAYASW